MELLALVLLFPLLFNFVPTTTAASPDFILTDHHVSFHPSETRELANPPLLGDVWNIPIPEIFYCDTSAAFVMRYKFSVRPTLITPRGCTFNYISLSQVESAHMSSFYAGLHHQ
jgi:hypothetical protein